MSNRKDGFCLSGSILAKSKFYGTNPRTTKIQLISPHGEGLVKEIWALVAAVLALSFYISGNSLSAILDGEARLSFLNRGEDYVMNMPYAHCKGQRATLK